MLPSVFLTIKLCQVSVEQCDFINENLEGFEVQKKIYSPSPFLQAKTRSNEIHQCDSSGRCFTMNKFTSKTPPALGETRGTNQMSRNQRLLMDAPSLPWYCMKRTACEDWGQERPSPSGAVVPSHAAGALGKGFPVALPAPPSPRECWKSLEHLSHRREEGGWGRVVLYGEYCVSSLVFLRLKGKALCSAFSPGVSHTRCSYTDAETSSQKTF